MRRAIAPNWKPNSLLVKLLAGFFTVIALLVSFNLLSYTFFNTSIRDQITVSNTKMLHHLSERYENQMQIVQSLMIKLYFNDKVALLNDWIDPREIDSVNGVVDEINKSVANELLYIDNIALLFARNSFAIDKNGPTSLDPLFGSAYKSVVYPPAFWRAQAKQPFLLRLYPQAEFYGAEGEKKGVFLPVAFKSLTHDQLFIVALLDANKLYAAFNNTSGSRFYMLDAEQKPVFASTDAPLNPDALTRLRPDEPVTKIGHEYYFYQTGALTGLTYISIIPNHKIADQMSKLNVILIVLLVLAITVSIAISIFISLRFNSPIRKIIETIRQFHPGGQQRGPEDEFRYIHDKVRHVLQAHREIRLDLDDKTLQLQTFEYINKLKNIDSRPTEGSDMERPFFLALFHLTKTKRFNSLVPAEQDKAAFYIKELIHLTLTEAFSETVTLLVEKDQILSLVFGENDADKLRHSLNRLKLVFDQDKEYGYLTIAFSSTLHAAANFAPAYDQALDMLDQRELKPETQMITEPGLHPLPVGFSPSQEQEFMAHLQAGNATNVVSMALRLFERMENNGASARQFADTSAELAAKVIKTLIAMNVEADSSLAADAARKLGQCATAADYKAFFERFLESAADSVRDKVGVQDRLKDILLDYVHKHYNEDITLDIVASKLNLSPGYVSRYFKEKTGGNFSDYLHELRIRKAKELLLQTNRQVKEIAERVGYFYVNSFNRMFKKVTGMSPGEYRRLNQRLEHGE